MFCLSIFHNLTPWTELVQPFFWLMVRKSMTFDLSRVCVCVSSSVPMSFYFSAAHSSVIHQQGAHEHLDGMGQWRPIQDAVKTYLFACTVFIASMPTQICDKCLLFLPSLPVSQGHGRHGTIFTIWIAWWLSLQPPLPMFWCFSSTI